MYFTGQIVHSIRGPYRVGAPGTTTFAWDNIPMPSDHYVFSVNGQICAPRTRKDAWLLLKSGIICPANMWQPTARERATRDVFGLVRPRKEP